MNFSVAVLLILMNCSHTHRILHFATDGACKPWVVMLSLVVLDISFTNQTKIGCHKQQSFLYLFLVIIWNLVAQLVSNPRKVNLRYVTREGVRSSPFHRYLTVNKWNLTFVWCNILSLFIFLFLLRALLLKPPYFINFFDCMHFSKNHFWPKTTEKMKIAQKQEKVDFFCAQNINYE